MKNKFSFWMVIGIGVGTAIGVAYKNIPAGVSIGAATGMLIMLLSFLKNKLKTKN
jgi:hypothetical protein